MTSHINQPADSVDTQFWRVFARVLGRSVSVGRYSKDDLREWDSLRHVELIFELEERFDLQISSEAIAKLYSDTDTVLDYLRQNGGAR